MAGNQEGSREEEYNLCTIERRKEKVLVKSVGHCSLKGRRENNEDEIMLRPKFVLDTSSPGSLLGPLSYFAVFDGHGGERCSKYARDNLLENLQLSLNRGIEPKDAFSNAFRRTEKDFFEAMPSSETSGTTALAVLIDNTNGKMWIANAGDSRAVLYRHKKVVALSRDHRADNPQEVERIHSAGGFIRHDRAMGRMECFRSIGDSDIDTNIVTAEPEISEYRFRGSDRFVLLGCDGLFDVMTNTEAVKFVRSRMKVGLSVKEIAEQLCHEAIFEKNSRDNVSVIIVQLECKELEDGEGDETGETGETFTTTAQ